MNKKDTQRKNKVEKEKNIINDEIYQAWRSKFLTNSNDAITIFFKVYEKRYIKTLKEAVDNRESNFEEKAHFWHVLYGFAIAQGILLIIILWPPWYELFMLRKVQTATFAEGILLIITLTLLLIVVKKLDVNKYQETWARTRQTLHDYRTEMLRYIGNMKPYDVGDADMKFQEQILKIMDKNREKFTKNLEEKEKVLTEELTLLKK